MVLDIILTLLSLLFLAFSLYAYRRTRSLFWAVIAIVWVFNLVMHVASWIIRFYDQTPF